MMSFNHIFLQQTLILNFLFFKKQFHLNLLTFFFKENVFYSLSVFVQIN